MWCTSGWMDKSIYEYMDEYVDGWNDGRMNEAKYTGDKKMDEWMRLQLGWSREGMSE